HLAGVTTREQQVERLRRPLEALDDVLGRLDLTGRQPAGHLHLRLRETSEVVEDEEALHAPPPDDQGAVVRRAAYPAAVVVGGDRPTQNHAAAQRELSEAGVEDLPSDVVEIEVDPIRRELPQARGDVLVLVVDRGGEAELIHDPAALLRAPGDADHLAGALDL